MLCGLDLQHPIRRFVDLREDEILEIENCLTSIIDHWSKLGATSIKGLREGFFSRDGKLVKNDDSWVLQVEQRSIDILLQHIPWMISLIKLPWMQHQLKVEWA